VKKFAFRLERLLQWRTLEREQEEGRLQALFSELEQLDAARRALERNAESAEESVLRPDVLTEERQALDGYRRFVTNERKRLLGLRGELETRIEKQRLVLVEAERKVEALSRMRDDKKAEWRVELDKEQEDLVSELVVARWGRRT
jgi:flagellar export protein FliJ